MNLATLLSLFLALVFTAQAVFVNDAFKKDWVSYNLGPAIKYALIDHETVLELSESNILYYRDILSSKIKGFIDLSLHGSNDFMVGDATIATFSNHSSLVSVFDRKTGIFIVSIPLENPPIQIKPYSNYGWTFLQEGDVENELVTWDGLTLTKLGRFSAHSFSQFSAPDTTYLCIEKSAFLLTFQEKEQGRVLEVATLDHGVLSDFLFPQMLADGGKLKSKQSTQVFITETVIVSYCGKSLVLSTISDGVPKTVFSKVYDEILDVQVSNKAFVVITQKKAHILDLAKFLDTGAEPSIQDGLVKVLPYLKHAILTSGHFITLNGDKSGEKVIVHDYDVKSDSSRVSPLLLSLFSATGESIIVNIPPLASRIEEAHHLVEESRSLSIIYRWIVRVLSHLSRFGRLLYNIISRTKSEASLTDEDVFGFNKILLQIDHQRLQVAAKSSRNGRVLWIHTIEDGGKIQEVRALGSKAFIIFDGAAQTLDLVSGELIASRVFDGVVEKVVTLVTDIPQDELDEHTTVEAIAVKIEDKLEYLVGEQNVSASQFILHQYANSLQAYRVDETSLTPTWQWHKPDHRLLAVTKNSNTLTSAGGIARYDRSVLYKYLNPNLVSIISEDNGKVIFTLVDGITGTVIHTQEHKDELIDLESICITQTDNWVVYSMFVVSPHSEQRLVAIDLFQDTKDISGAEKTAFNSPNVTASAKTFIYPERIMSLESTVTKFGITVKSIIALTQSGSLVDIPKFLLNSRRVDGRKLTTEDQMDDFRMLPYEPGIPQNTFKVLNHKYKLQVSENLKILVLPTELESTSVVCFVNKLNDFCTIVQPSSSYDLLKSDFDKPKLILTIAALVAAYLFSKPLVLSKKLNQKWID
ncbi:DUF1620-domain-containing protein [Metschnikowia bicuspidata var. bicuspidata NRRL YB-4993]|uniref:ER membrane protein complex subunit 1 n=1 Tax=Metschnikowia bicuspidata var. bicuspidata NRRL YB-4993 TaxID=869754 RepID=A0A1A0H265_9ASCO|nr:DUF1620-domain-containing protein [Metschnikowia bicuspidata var. bicuspidata NRRL YB-4993]OBA18048.1 DUF1620-domain-containing protein [Metschnikowia bicuspidata var. bicuspidata NRRL YB-4993]